MPMMDRIVLRRLGIGIERIVPVEAVIIWIHRCCYGYVPKCQQGAEHQHGRPQSHDEREIELAAATDWIAEKIQGIGIILYGRRTGSSSIPLTIYTMMSLTFYDEICVHGHHHELCVGINQLPHLLRTRCKPIQMLHVTSQDCGVPVVCKPIPTGPLGGRPTSEATAGELRKYSLCGVLWVI